MAVQILTVLRRPSYAFLTLTLAVLISLTFLYLDEFYFVSPYIAVYVDPSRVSVLSLDISISVSSGIVFVVSVYEIRTFQNLEGLHKKTGLVSVLTAVVAGACPCNYLVPLLGVLGGASGALGALGILIYEYQLPIKFASLGLLVFTIFTLERGLRAACAMQA